MIFFLIWLQNYKGHWQNSQLNSIFFKWSTLCNLHSNRNNGKVGLKFWCCSDQRLQLSPGSFLLCFLTVSLPPVIPGQCMSLYATVIPLLPYVRKGVCVWVPVDLRLNIKPLHVIRERERQWRLKPRIEEPAAKPGPMLPKKKNLK